MGRADELSRENVEIAINIAIKVGLLTNCSEDLHEHISYNPGDYEFLDVVKEIKEELLISFSKDRQVTIFNLIKNLEEITDYNCSDCERPWELALKDNS